MRRAAHAPLGRRLEGSTAREVLRLRLLGLVRSGQAGVGPRMCAVPRGSCRAEGAMTCRRGEVPGDARQKRVIAQCLSLGAGINGRQRHVIRDRD